MTHAPTVILSRTASALAGLGRRVEVPKRLGSVVLLKELGEGGMSVVHLGRHEILQKNVAVKFLLDVPGSEDDPRFTSFLEGARAAAAIRHAGLNVVHHADSIEGVPYLVMELIEGPTLAELVHEHGPLPLNIARAVIECVCAAVGELHGHGVIHRDIKPANIMIDPAGCVIVTDFGLAMQRPASLFGGQPGGGGLSGTPTYMAPEMFEANVSARTDVYALGVTMFELLTGKPPYAGDFQGLRLAHRTGSVPVSRLAEHGVPEGVIVVIERAMHKEVLFRPKSASHVLDAFRKACEAAGIDRATEAQIQRFVEVGRGGAASGAPRSTPTPAYYERLNTLAGQKRRTPDGMGSAGPAGEGDGGEQAANVAAAHAAPVPEATPQTSGPAREVRRARRGVPAAAALPLVALGAALASVPGYHAGEWARGQALAVFGDAPPAWARLAAGTLMVAIFLGLPMAAAWVGYVRVVLARPRLDGVTRCGWCGGALTGVRDRRCPECGRLAGSTATGVKGDAPVAHRLGTRVRDYGVAAAVFAVAMAGAAAVYYPALERLFGVAPTSPTWRGVAGMVALVWPAAALSLLALHAVARRSAPLCGRTYCGTCGVDLAGITSPECPACRAGL